MSFGVFIVLLLILFCKKTLFNSGLSRKSVEAFFMLPHDGNFATTRCRNCYVAMKKMRLRDAAFLHLVQIVRIV